MVDKSVYSILAVANLSDCDVEALFRRLRWQDGIECPLCACSAVYEVRVRRIFVCKSCNKQFRLTTGTALCNRKLPLRAYLLAASLFVKFREQLTAARLASILGVEHRTASCLLDKFLRGLPDFPPSRDPGMTDQLVEAAIASLLRQKAESELPMPSATLAMGEPAVLGRTRIARCARP